jgi:hypothetical protein
MCPKNLCEGACINITDVSVTPGEGPIGTIFEVNVSILVNKPTGVGSVSVKYSPQDSKYQFFFFFFGMILTIGEQWYMFLIKVLLLENTL